MPANLTPQYLKAERVYRQAQTAAEQQAALESMLQLIPKHKGTDRLQGELRARLKEAREEVQAEKSAPRPGKTYRINRQGSGTVVLVGAPNSGKSRIVKELTNATPEVAPYPFTTREPLMAMMSWEDIKVQLVDTPPITSSHLEPYLTGFARSADAVVLCMDGSADDAPGETQKVISQLKHRKTLLSNRTGFDEEDFSIVHVRTLLCVTRGSDPDVELRLEFLREPGPIPWEPILVDLDLPGDVEHLRRQIAASLDLIRLYTKRPGKPADFESPFTIPHGGTVEDLAEKVHKDLAASFKHAKVWHHGEQHPNAVGRDHVLADRDIVELHG